MVTFLGTEDTILYAAAFDANGGVFEPLFGAEDAIISDALGAVADAVGRESAAGKAFAVAQAVMNTYSAANKAMSAYPPPFSFIAAATTIAAGLMNVKKIISTPLPATAGGSNAGASVSAPVAPPITAPLACGLQPVRSFV